MKKLDLGGIQPATKTARATHPTIQFDSTEANQLAEQWVQINPQFKTLKNQNDTLAKQLGGYIKRSFFTKFAGVMAESSTMLVNIGARTVKLITKNAYSKTVTDEKDLVAIIGQEAFNEHFRWVTVFKLELDKAPEDKGEPFAHALIALAAEMGTSDCVSASQCVQPKAGFHEARTSLFTPDQNMAIDALLPITAYPQL